jgi:hypothetical protein
LVIFKYNTRFSQISGEATLHQKLGEQDSWLKPKLLAAKLELSRQTPIRLRRSTRSDDVVQRRVTLLLAVAFFVATVCCNFSSDSPMQTHPAFSAFGYAEFVTSFLLIVLVQIL